MMTPRKKLSTWPRRLRDARGMAVHGTLYLIDPEREHDTALAEHEMEHCKHQRELGTFSGITFPRFGGARFWVNYPSPSFRLAAEVRGYRAQLAAIVRIYGNSFRDEYVEKFAKALTTRYLLQYFWPIGAGLTMERARALLRAP